jgi:hypothetical protein
LPATTHPRSPRKRCGTQFSFSFLQMMEEETLVPVELDRIIDSLLSSLHCFLARNLYMWLPWLGATDF